METLYRVPFLVLECPNLKLKKPPWVHMPSAMTVYALVVVSYFLITGGNSAVMGRVGAAEARGCRAQVGIIYDVIVEPPSVGSMTDEHGHQRPVAFLAYRVNGQYIMEGLASSFLFTMGGLGFIILDRSNAPNIPKLNRFLLLFIGFVCVLLSFFMARVFMRMKLPFEIIRIPNRRRSQMKLLLSTPAKLGIDRPSAAGPHARTQLSSDCGCVRILQGGSPSGGQLACRTWS
ncbi:Oligosaccharyltransferase complex subunit OSTC [Microtus ochrogaster]|uniref:Oligosaccharyltransferase complex subunit n=1 Tax=Microtus ochrogaster TaxID=79684 RepID=A0A8J6FZ69_MICOH|nr:Oligosaccharyltransferase complex subunit OSTC [Microtus ochrogaster]